MVSEGLHHIVCALRGRPESRATVTKAIDLARENDAQLTFVHVFNADFMGSAAPTMTSVQVVYRQLESMSRFVMELLCDRARRRGVEKVDCALRSGDIPTQLLKVMNEFKADGLVIGKPSKDTEIGGVFTAEEYDQFIQTVEQELGVSVFQVESKVDNHMKDEDYFEM